MEKKHPDSLLSHRKTRLILDLMRADESGQSALLLLDVIQILNQFKIPYAIIGAFAASFYGIVRASLDADALIFFDNENGIKQLCSALKEKGLRVKYKRGDANDPVKGVINVQDTYQNRVDLLLGIRGMKQDVFQRISQSKFMDCSIKVIGPEDFIAMKIFAGSPKDIQDVIGVLDISKDKLNLPLLKKVTAGFGRSYLKTLNKILKRK